MLTAREIAIWVVMLPGGVALAIMLIALAIGRLSGVRQPWAAALAVWAGFSSAFWAIKGIGSFPPADAQTWLVHLGLAAVWIALIGMLRWRGARAVSVISSIALIVAMVWLLTRPLARRVEPAEYWPQFALLACGAAAWWGLMETLAARAARASDAAHSSEAAHAGGAERACSAGRAGGADRAERAGLVLLLAVWAGAAGVVLLDSSSVVLGQLAWSTSAALAAVALASWTGRDVSLSRGGMLAVTIALGGLLLCGHLFADLTRWDLAWLAAAPLLLWIGELRILKRPAARWTVRTIALLAAVAVPLVPAVIGLWQTMREQTEGYLY